MQHIRKLIHSTLEMPCEKNLPCSNDMLLKIAAEQQTPFHLISEEKIRATCRDFLAAFGWAPQFKNFFAVKALPYPHILRIMREEGFGVDCSSIPELRLAAAAGFPGDDIVFSSNNTTLEEFRIAKEMKVRVNFDDISGFKFFEEKLGLPEFVCCRFNPGGLRTGNKYIGDPKSAKFGLTRPQLMELFATAKSKGVSRFGLHTMVVSSCLDIAELTKTAEMMFEVAADLKKEHSINLDFIDLGGGIGIPYMPEQSPVDVQQLGLEIKELYDRILVPIAAQPTLLAFECGRMVTGPSGWLVSRVINKKETYRTFVGVDACMAHLMRPGMYGAYHHISVVPEKSDSPALASLPSDRTITPEGGVVDVVGSLCENNDKFADQRKLPEVRIGDLMVFHDSGAHGQAMGFNYNGKLRCAEYLMNREGALTMVRRPETYEDLVATYVHLPAESSRQH